MNKDVLYIDVEDDITAIVGKVKASSERIIALVPPKRVGVLQSAVSMRLLARTAEQAGKRIVLITSDQILAGLAASAKIPVAKTLQSKPEIADIPALKIDDESDVIDGRELPIAMHEKEKAENAAVDAVVAEDKANEPPKSKKASLADKKNAPKVPNFNVFRKKFVLIGAGALLLIGFLVWAIWFAPRATVVIAAKTTTETVDKQATLKQNAATDPKTSIVKTLRQEQKAELSVEFAATGKKKVGERAKGRLRLATDSIQLLDKTVPAGTTVRTSSGIAFTTDSAVTFSRTNNTGAVVSVTASDIGAEYNGETGSVSGLPANVSGSLVGATSGGSSREVTVVSADDLKKATEQLNGKKDDALQDKLAQSFGSSAIFIKESYKEDRSAPAPSVAVDTEASGNVVLKTTVTASALAVDKTDLSAFIKDAVEKQLEGKQSQKIYKDGTDDVKFTQFVMAGDGTATVRITANATVGPSIDEAKVKEQVQGKTFGDVQSQLEAINGVDNVDVQFWPFWVRTIPNDATRISVEFKLHER